MRSRYECRTWAPLVLLLVYVAARLYMAVGIEPKRFNDTGTYERFSWTLFNDRGRPWTVPLFYGLIRNPTARVLVQLGVSIACWAFAAWTFARTLAQPVLRWATGGTVLGLSLLAGPAAWDVAILSESLAVSLTVAVVALWYRVVEDPGRSTVSQAVLGTTLWVFTRPLHLLLAGLVALVVLILAIAVRNVCCCCCRRSLLAGGSVLLLVVVLGLVPMRTASGLVWRYNFCQVLNVRVASDASYLEWFRRAGAPLTSEFAGDFDPTICPRQPALLSYIDQQGRGDYLRFVAGHPRYWSDAVTGLPDQIVSLMSYPLTRQVVPLERQLELLRLIPVLGLALLGAAWACLRGRFSARLAFAGGLTSLAILHLLLTWFLSASDLPRLGLVPTIQLVLGLLLLSALTLDALLAPDRPAVVIAPPPVET